MISVHGIIVQTQVPANRFFIIRDWTKKKIKNFSKKTCKSVLVMLIYLYRYYLCRYIKEDAGRYSQSKQFYSRITNNLMRLNHAEELSAEKFRREVR